MNQPLPPSRPASSAVDESLEQEIAAALGGQSVEDLMAAEEAQAAAEKSQQAQATETGDGAEVHHEFKRGRISAIRGEDVFVELTGESSKLQGVVPLIQFERAPRLGSIMDFIVDHVDEAQGLIFLSREGAISRSTWDQLVVGSVVEARVTGSNKGGLELEMVGSIKAFMPASQIDLHHVENLEEFVGQQLEAQVQEIDRKGKKVLLSRRRHLEQLRTRQRAKVLADLAVDQVREGVVSSLVDFGAFVDLGGVDGLVHVSDISHQRVNKPKDVLKVGQKVQVKVLKIDAGKDRIALGIKQVAPDPWDEVAGPLRAGDQVSGRVTRTADFGAFVEIAPGVEGLLPISELSWKRVHRTEEVVKVGDAVRVAVLKVEQEKRRLSLSLKQAGGDPWIGAERKYEKGAIITGKVISVTDFGAFVELEQGVDGLVHISELSDRRVSRVEEVLKVGDEKQFRVVEISEEKRKIGLSLKQVAKLAEASAAEQAQEAALAARPAVKRIPRDKLKSGLGSTGALGMGLGSLSLDNLK